MQNNIQQKLSQSNSNGQIPASSLAEYYSSDEEEGIDTIPRENFFLRKLQIIKRALAKNSKIIAKDFKTFALRGNVFDLAIGLIMGSAFTSVISSIVNDMISPFLGLVISDVTLENAFIVLRCGKLNVTDPLSKVLEDCSSTSYPTVQIAKAHGAITWNWGSFLQTSINFIIISLIVFLLVKIYTTAVRIKARTPHKTHDCPFCLQAIPKKAVRCCFCTSEIVQDVNDLDRTPVQCTRNYFKEQQCIPTFKSPKVGSSFVG